MRYCLFVAFLLFFGEATCQPEDYKLPGKYVPPHVISDYKNFAWKN